MADHIHIPPVHGRGPPPIPEAPPMPPPPRIPAPPRIPGPLRVPRPPKIPPPLTRFFKPHEPVIGRSSLLTPAELDRFKDLLVFARSMVEGYFVGKHKSPYRGSS